MKNQNFLFITGTKRSASHYLNRLFDGHPEVANTIVESYMFEYWFRHGCQYENQLIKWVKTVPASDIFQHILYRELLPAFKGRIVTDSAFRNDNWFDLDFDHDHFCHLLDKRRGKIGSVREFVLTWTALLDEFSPWNKMVGKRRWLYKCADFGYTLMGAKSLDLLAFAVFLVRNPLDIVNSLKKRRELETSRDFHVFELLDICNNLENIHYFLKANTGKVMIVRYEDLIRRKKNTLEKICRFWRIEWSDCLNTPTLLGTPWKVNSSFGNEMERKDILTAWEKEMIRQNTKTYQNEFGYPI